MNFQDALIPDDEEWARARATAGTGSYTHVRRIGHKCQQYGCDSWKVWLGVFDDTWLVTECQRCTHTKWYKRRETS
jgi:hypothetical protein